MDYKSSIWGLSSDKLKTRPLIFLNYELKANDKIDSIRHDYMIIMVNILHFNNNNNNDNLESNKKIIYT